MHLSGWVWIEWHRGHSIRGLYGSDLWSLRYMNSLILFRCGRDKVDFDLLKYSVEVYLFAVFVEIGGFGGG